MQEQNEVLEILQQLREELNAPRGVFGKRTDIAYCCVLWTTEKKAAQLSSEAEVVKQAQMNAKRIVDNAYVQCDNLIMRTKTHLDEMFKETEQFLLSTLAVIRTNREELRAVRMDTDTADDGR